MILCAIVWTEHRRATGERMHGVDDVGLVRPFEEVPRAPARIAANTDSSSPYIVSMSTPMCGLVRTSARVASTPFVPGICRSITTTSGWSSAAIAIASVARGGHADDRDVVGCLEHRRQAVEEDGVVVGDEDSGRFHGVTRKGREGVVPILHIGRAGCHGSTTLSSSARWCAMSSR